MGGARAPLPFCIIWSRIRSVYICVSLRHGMHGGVRGVIEVEKHGRAFGRGFEQVAEAAPDMRADDLAIIDDFQDAVGAFLHVDVEMVAPKIDQHFLELALRINGPDQLGLLQLADGRDRAVLVGLVGHPSPFSRWRRELVAAGGTGWFWLTISPWPALAAAPAASLFLQGVLSLFIKSW